MGKCQTSFEENAEAYHRMDGNCQRGQEGGDGELVIFSGESNQRTCEDCKRVKLTGRFRMIDPLGM
jgi:hypothetical protein